MAPTVSDRILSAFVSLLMALLAVVEWESISPPWAQWPLAVLGAVGMAGVVRWMGRPGPNEGQGG